jgi:hypothetical protein
VFLPGVPHCKQRRATQAGGGQQQGKQELCA